MVLYKPTLQRNIWKIDIWILQQNNLYYIYNIYIIYIIIVYYGYFYFVVSWE